MQKIFGIVLIAGVLLMLSGCQKKEDDAFVSRSLRDVAAPGSIASPATTQPARSSQSAQSIPTVSAPSTGIEISNDRIVIDAKQVRSFFDNLAKKFDSSLKKMEADLKQNHQQIQNPTGIIVTEDRIEVDLNKTERFMEKWIKSMESIGRELDSTFRQLDQSLR
jgi:hypothetical protein